MKSLLILFVALFYLNATIVNAQVGIGTTNPDPSSVLDISSTDGGVLVPRMTEADKNAITTPAQGLMVYQTDGTSGFYYFDGSWQLIGANDEDWTVSGNSMYATNANFVGIGDTTPTSKLSITSDAATDAISVDAAGFSVSTASTSNYGGGSEVIQVLSSIGGFNTIQTFIAEDSGFMKSVSVIVRATPTVTFRLSLRDSSGNSLATVTYVQMPGSWDTMVLDIPSGSVPIVAGTQYQIFLELLSTGGQLLWRASDNDNYPNGSATNSASNPNVDMYFSTVVENLFDQDFVVNAQGNVGVGTGSPSATLDVAGTFRLRDNGATDGAVLVSDANGNATWQSDVVALEAPIPVTSYGANYSDYNSGYQNPTYYIDRGRVYIEGLARRSSPAFSTNEVIFTLPVGYRPLARLNFACLQGNDILRVDIFPDGQVRYITGANGSSDWVTLSGISFRAN